MKIRKTDSMNYGFDSDRLVADLQDLQEFFVGFIKSFGTKAKKIQGKEIGFFEENYTRFRLGLVDMGISTVIRISLIIIVGIITSLVFFQTRSSFWRVVIGFAFIWYVAWQMMPDIEKSKKENTGGFIGEILFIFYDWTTELFTPIPPKKEEKKK